MARRLKELAGSDVDDPAMAQVTIPRSRASLLTVRDMRLVLLATADTPAWARQTVMDDLVLHPERARQVLATCRCFGRAIHGCRPSGRRRAGAADPASPPVGPGSV